MKELIDQIKLKADSWDNSTKETRARKGAYVDCLIMAKEASKNIVLPDVSGQLLSFFLWFRANGELHIDKSIEAMIEIYLKESNYR